MMVMQCEEILRKVRVLISDQYSILRIADAVGNAETKGALIAAAGIIETAARELKATAGIYE